MSEVIAAPFLADLIDPKGFIEPGRFSDVLRVTKGELASASGLSREAVSKATRLASPATQARLHEVAEIINRVLPWCGSVPQAFAWYRAQPLPSFGQQTAEDLVKEGRAADVKRYLSRIAIGGYA
jgi:hypothetical protein